MTSTAPGQSTTPSLPPTGQNEPYLHVHQDIDTVKDGGVVVGVNQGTITVTIGKRDVRAEELAYLDGLIEKYRYWAEKYTPLAGIAEVRAAAAEGPRLDLPMLFMPTGFEKLEEHGFGVERRTERVPVDDLRDAVKRYQRLVLLGEPGSGKTTTLWRLAYDLAVAAKDDPQAPLPLLVPLGGYTSPENALAYATTYFEELGPYLPAYLRSRRVVLLLDALNEMPQSGYKERVGRIQALLDQYPDTPAVVTCRALDYVKTLKLEKLEVKPLHPDRQHEYLHRYLGANDGEKLFWQLCGAEIAALWRTWQEAGATWEQFWTANEVPDGVRISRWNTAYGLWPALRQGWLPPLLTLGRNPFMLVMTAQIYAAGKGALPPNRGRLFAAFVDTLLDREEKRCDPALWPGADTLRRSMVRLAYAMQKAGERGTAVDVSWAEKQMAQQGVDTSRVIYLCASATLLDTANSQLRFVHQLIQEYFAALALAEQLRVGDDLRGYWRRGWPWPSGWEETFVLLAGMLPDMTLLIQRLLTANPALAARCMGESGGDWPDDRTTKQVQKRLAGLATSPKAPLAQRNVAGDALNHVADPRPGVALRPDGLPDIVWCPVEAGEFIMVEKKSKCSTNMAAFEISKYPITNAQFEAFVQDGGYTAKQWRNCWTKAGLDWRRYRTGPDRYGGAFDLPNHPVVGVSWYEAVAFCNWLSEKLGRPVSLPSEAQWERAARHTDGRRYPWRGGILTPYYANYNQTHVNRTSAVGIFPKGISKCGAQDMSGNTWEWCQTKLSANYNTPPDNDPEGNIMRVVRGGSFKDGTRIMRCVVRNWYFPSTQSESIGFRVAVASP